MVNSGLSIDGDTDSESAISRAIRCNIRQVTDRGTTEGARANIDRPHVPTILSLTSASSHDFTLGWHRVAGLTEDDHTHRLRHKRTQASMVLRPPDSSMITRDATPEIFLGPPLLMAQSMVIRRSPTRTSKYEETPIDQSLAMIGG